MYRAGAMLRPDAAIRLSTRFPARASCPGHCAVASSLARGHTRTLSSKTAKVDRAVSEEIVVQRRLRRPVAPHLTVYQVNQTWIGSSIWMRFTGVGLMGVGYAYFIGYAVSPLFGWQLDSGSLAAAFGDMSALARGGIKFGLAFPFIFHFVNGIKQLVYDMSIGYSRATINFSNKFPFVIGAAGALALAIAF